VRPLPAGRPAALIALLVCACVIAGLTARAAWARVRQHAFKAGIASCYIPHNVYGGTGQTITAAQTAYTNDDAPATVQVKAFEIIIDTSTQKWVRTYYAGSRTVARGVRVVFPEVTLDLDFRSVSNFFPAGVRTRLEVFRNRRLTDVWTGVPPLYKIFTNGAFFRTYSGTGSSC
jgi:hypothetical protein